MENMEHKVPEFEWLGINFDASALMMIGITTVIVLNSCNRRSEPSIRNESFETTKLHGMDH